MGRKKKVGRHLIRDRRDYGLELYLIILDSGTAALFSRSATGGHAEVQHCA